MPAMRATRSDGKICPGRTKKRRYPPQGHENLPLYTMTAQFPTTETKTTVPVRHEGTFFSYRDNNATDPLSRYCTATHSPATGTTTEDVRNCCAARRRLQQCSRWRLPRRQYQAAPPCRHQTRPFASAATVPASPHSVERRPMASPKRPTPTTPSKTKRRNPQNEETRRREPPGEREERRRVQLWGPETSPPE